MPLQGVDVMRLLVEEPLLELADQLPALLAVCGPALLLVELVERAIGVAAVVDGAPVEGLELEEGEVGLDDVAAVEVGGDLEIAAADVRIEHAELERLDLGGEADLPPLVGEPDPERHVGIRDPAILESEGEAVRHARLAEQSPGFRARLDDVAAIAGQSLQLGRRGGQRCPGPLYAGYFLQDGDLRKRLGALPAVQGQSQGPADPLVVEGLALVVEAERVDALPRALLHGDLRSERGYQSVPLRRREAAKLDHRPLAADRPHLHGRVRHEERAVAVEIRLALVPVARVLLADPV